MGIFDIFTNDSAEEAARRNSDLYRQYGQQGNSTLSDYGTQTGNLFNNYSTQGNNLYSNQNTTGTNILNTGLSSGRSDLTNAINSYQPLSQLAQRYGGATSLLLDALGANGQEGTTRAQNAFQTSPGYNFAVNQATDAAARRAASLGMANSGNALDEIRNRAQGYAQQEYNNYLSNLSNFINPELSATSGAASGTAQGYTNLANLGSTDTGRRLELLNNTTQGQSSVLGNTTAGQANLLRDIAQGRLGISGNVTSGQASANNAEAQAANQGSATFWNALASLGSGALRGYYGQSRAA